MTLEPDVSRGPLRPRRVFSLASSARRVPRAALRVVLLACSAALLAGCGATTANAPSRPAATSPHPPAAPPSRAQPQPPPSSICPPADTVLAGVYHPARLHVLDPCRRAAGTIQSVRHEPDGDLHIDVRLDRRSARLINAVNRAEQHEALVVEFMPRDGGHLPAPQVDDRISLLGAHVEDTQHGWLELHPVFAVRLNRAPTAVSGPQFGGSPAQSRSGTAAQDCRTPTGQRCHGYPAPEGATSRDPDEDTTTPAASPPSTSRPAGSPTPSQRCEPGYSPCLPVTSDLDCADLPAATKPVRVTGTDPYHLDADHNGTGCENPR